LLNTLTLAEHTDPPVTMTSIRHTFTVLKYFVKGADLMEVIRCMVQAVCEVEGGSQFNMERDLF